MRNGGEALALGALWGWLPSGLVYSVLTAAYGSPLFCHCSCAVMFPTGSRVH